MLVDGGKWGKPIDGRMGRVEACAEQDSPRGVPSVFQRQYQSACSYPASHIPQVG